MAEITVGLTLDAGPAKASAKTLGDVAQAATRQVDGLSRAQQELVAKSERVAQMANTVDIQNKKAVATYLQEVAQVRALAQQIGVLDEVQRRTAQSTQEVTSHTRALADQQRALRMETATLSGATVNLGAATGVTRGGLNALRSSVTSMASAALGGVPGVAQFTGALGTMAIGAGWMIAVMAGMAAVVTLWDKLTEGARKAKKETDEAIEALGKLRDKERQGAGGETVDQVARAKEQLNKDRQALAAMQASTVAQSQFSIVGGGFSTTQGDPVQKAKEIADLQAKIAAGERFVTKAVTEAGTTLVQTTTSNLATLVASKNATAAELRNAELLLAGFKQSLDALSGDGSKNAERATLIAQIKELDEALHPKTKREPKTQDQRDREEIAALFRTLDEEKSRQNEQDTQRSADAVSGLNAEHEAAERMLDAWRQGSDAVKQLTEDEAVYQALEKAGLTLADAAYEATERKVRQTIRARGEVERLKDAQATADTEAKRGAEEAAREIERRFRQLQRTVSSAANQFLTDVFSRRNPIPGLADAIKAQVIGALAEAFARPVAVRIAKILGMEAPEEKQAKAARLMKEAADKQLRAAEIMSGRTPSSEDTTKPPTVAQAAWRQAMGIGKAGLGGYATGYGLGQMTGSGVIGGLGGALAGAKMGAPFGPAGIAVGALAGLAGGIIGAGDAAAAARQRMRELKEAFQNTFDTLRAELNKDTLGQAVAQVTAQYQDATRQFLDQLSAGDILTGKWVEGLKELQAMQAQRIAQLREEAAILQTRQIEDFRVRELRAKGDTKGADSLAFRLQQERERQDLIRSFGTKPDGTPDIDAREKEVLAALDAAQAAERLAQAAGRAADSLDAFTARNAPTGYKVESRIFDFATPAKRTPTSPLTPTAPQFSGGGNKTYNLTFAPVIDGTKATRSLARDLAVEYRKVVTETLGKDVDPANAIGLLA